MLLKSLHRMTFGLTMRVSVGWTYRSSAVRNCWHFQKVSTCCCWASHVIDTNGDMSWNCHSIFISFGPAPLGSSKHLKKLINHAGNCLLHQELSRMCIHSHFRACLRYYICGHYLRAILLRLRIILPTRVHGRSSVKTSQSILWLSYTAFPRGLHGLALCVLCFSIHSSCK